MAMDRKTEDALKKCINVEAINSLSNEEKELLRNHANKYRIRCILSDGSSGRTKIRRFRIDFNSQHL